MAIPAPLSLYRLSSGILRLPRYRPASSSQRSLLLTVKNSLWLRVLGSYTVNIWQTPQYSKVPNIKKRIVSNTGLPSLSAAGRYYLYPNMIRSV